MKMTKSYNAIILYGENETELTLETDKLTYGLKCQEMYGFMQSASSILVVDLVQRETCSSKDDHF